MSLTTPLFQAMYYVYKIRKIYIKLKHAVYVKAKKYYDLAFFCFVSLYKSIL